MMLLIEATKWVAVVVSMLWALRQTEVWEEPWNCSLVSYSSSYYTPRGKTWMDVSKFVGGEWVGNCSAMALLWCGGYNYTWMTLRKSPIYFLLLKTQAHTHTHSHFQQKKGLWCQSETRDEFPISRFTQFNHIHTYILPKDKLHLILLCYKDGFVSHLFLRLPSRPFTWISS